ncbi:PREDICTED: uncharacterized protein LOC109362610 isoform X4 [Lupinus angustifolius]|uniref:uncharacterized protein LOC109362610 isoform X4 n=1 Tax=Lupinus angustifolius TaxID=3871 RepID=UPI00092F00B4|nr:PREDICTED: uncharacterized protein LOC109362610 isoform X4 [Lupinus angustifolius]
MLMVYAPGAYQHSASAQQSYPYKTINVIFINSNPAFLKPNWWSPCNSNSTSSSNIFHSSSFSGKCVKPHKNLHLLFHHVATTHKCLEFIAAGVNAYALGCTDEGLRKELTDMKDSGFEIEAMQNYGGSTSLKSKIISEEVDECILWLSIIFITILCTPQPTIVRWSSTPSVSDEVKLQWEGFCALIANAYFMKGMAWLPVKTLQLEQTAVMGQAEKPSVVASRMRLVFSTLEVSILQFATYLCRN